MDLYIPIATGNTASIYLQDETAIKLFHNHVPDGTGSYEAKKQNYAFSHGLPVPEIYDITHINGQQAILMEYISGPTISNLIQLHPERIASWLSLSIDIQKDLHSINADSFALEAMNIRFEQQIQSAADLNNEQRDSLLNQLQLLPIESQLCHGDFHVQNLIKQKEAVFIIDWVDAVSGHPLADVCRTYLLYLSFCQSVAEMYLDLYCLKSNVSKAEIFQWIPVVAAARLTEHISSVTRTQLLSLIHQYL